MEPLLHVALAATNILAIGSASVNASLTFITIPRILELHFPLNLWRWQSMFEVTKWWVAGPMVASGVSYLWFAWTLHSRRLSEADTALVPQLLVTSGVLCLSIVPYTTIVVLPTIKKLWAKVNQYQDVPDVHLVSKEDDIDETVHSLIMEWGTWNIGRAVLVLIAGVVGMYAAHNL